MTSNEPWSQLEKAWAEAKPPRGGSLGDVPDGGYRAELIGSRLSRIKRGEHKDGPKIVLTFRILEGACRQRRVVKHLALTASAEQLGFVRRDLATLGADLETLSREGLEAALARAKGTAVWLRLATRERFQQVEIRTDLAAEVVVET